MCICVREHEPICDSSSCFLLSRFAVFSYSNRFESVRFHTFIHSSVPSKPHPHQPASQPKKKERENGVNIEINIFFCYSVALCVCALFAFSFLVHFTLLLLSPFFFACVYPFVGVVFSLMSTFLFRFDFMCARFLSLSKHFQAIVSIPNIYFEKQWGKNAYGLVIITGMNTSSIYK